MKAFEYFNEFFSKRYGEKQAEKIAHLAVELVQPLIKGDDKNVKDLLEGFSFED